MHNLRWTLTKTMLSCSLVVCSAVPVVLLSSMLRWDRHRPCCAVCFLSIALALHGRFLMPVMVPRFFPPSSPTMLAPFSPPHTLPGSRWGGGDPTHNHTAQHNTTQPPEACVWGGKGAIPYHSNHFATDGPTRGCDTAPAFVPPSRHRSASWCCRGGFHWPET